MTTREPNRKRKPPAGAGDGGLGALALSAGAPDVLLLDGEDVLTAVRAALDTRDWWLIPVVSERSLTLMSVLERAHYDGKANRDFRIVMAPPHVCGVWSIALAHKRHATPAQVAALMDVPGETRAELARSLEHQDVLVCLGGPSPEEREASAARVVAFGCWVQHGPGQPDPEARP